MTRTLYITYSQRAIGLVSNRDVCRSIVNVVSMVFRRITDHRIGLTIYNLQAVMRGYFRIKLVLGNWLLKISILILSKLFKKILIMNNDIILYNHDL